MESEAGTVHLKPPTPLPPPPRTVRRRGWLLTHVPLVLWPLVLAALGLLLLALWLLGSSLAVTRFGMTVPGKVTATLPGEPGTNPRVQFSYFVGEQEHAGEAALDRDAFRRLYTGAEVKVKVLRSWPGNPRLVQPAGRAGVAPGCLSLVALLCNGVVGLIVWACLRKTLAQRRLVREGLATAGQIVAKEPAGGHGPGLVQFVYRAPARGPSADAPVPERDWQVVMAVGRKDFAAAQVGAAVTVLYDPRQPSRSILYPFAEYEAVASPPPSTQPG